LDDAVRYNAREGRCDAADNEEDGITLLKLVASVPCGEQVDTAWKVTCFEDPKDDTESKHLVPSSDETKCLEIIRRRDEMEIGVNIRSYRHPRG
jgi:hypothetical protein